LLVVGSGGDVGFLVVNLGGLVSCVVGFVVVSSAGFMCVTGSLVVACKSVVCVTGIVVVVFGGIFGFVTGFLVV
jgi:hypothetical protein